MYHQEWEEGTHDDYDETDTTDEFADTDEYYRCDTCGEKFVPNWSQIDCDSCQTAYWRRNPHPLDIAQEEFEQDQYPDFVERSYGE